MNFWCLQVRKHFYEDAVTAMQAALSAGRSRIRLRCIIPELNVETDGKYGSASASKQEVLHLRNPQSCLLCHDGAQVDEVHKPRLTAADACSLQGGHAA
jgi:hypothetical protein